MKKIFSWILGIFTIFFIFFEQSFSATLSFVTKDGSVFCETDTFDGQYKLCDVEQMASPHLGQTWRYGPQLIETKQAKICVEKGKEVDGGLCGIEKSTEKIFTNTGILMENQSGIKNNSHTGDSLVVMPALTGSTNTGTDIIIENNIDTQLPLVVSDSGSIDNIYILHGRYIIDSLQASFFACIWTIPNRSCAMDTQLIMQSIENIGIYLVWGIFLFICFCCIFWWMMFVHALSNPISYKIVWILVIFIFSILGAIAYYFIVNRPYVAAQLSLLPPKPLSFFD